MEVARGNWVGFGTVFYNLKSGKYSKNINEVIDHRNLEIDREGLAAYLDFGYSVFGRTPVKDVRYLLPGEFLVLQDDNLSVRQGEDTTLRKLGIPSRVEDVLGLLENSVNNWASSFSEDILIPTSGGFDSRLLNVLTADKERIHSYTYGTSYHQNKSREAVYASELSKKLGTYWKRIDLGKFNQYIPDWYGKFGPAVAASGTYHMEFYKKIKHNEQDRKLGLLSGIIGDAWAGAVNVPPVTGPAEYIKLGYTHGMSADSSRAINASYKELAEQAYERNRDHLDIPEFRIITAMRTKMMLLQYLISVPEEEGFFGYSPFIDEDISLATLNLPIYERQGRKWQRDYFRDRGLLFEEQKHDYTYQNSLNYDALRHETLDPLNVKLLREVFREEYIHWINAELADMGMSERVFQRLMHTPKVKEVLKLAGFKNKLISAYFAYITIKPIEILLEKRNAS
ncbi:hypothetical protein HP439_11345 [Sphingobacterium shayense]|uniref:hypothetical protein n=1 Tax=Sphingobacterium shayense TaxID=626343 RepID=UPI0015540EC4|nr:hypothetical protein [Sphingobacterium shayense]NQD71315.1 hypothetical protein [Sphingobacterium shayense]